MGVIASTTFKFDKYMTTVNPHTRNYISQLDYLCQSLRRIGIWNPRGEDHNITETYIPDQQFKVDWIQHSDSTPPRVLQYTVKSVRVHKTLSPLNSEMKSVIDAYMKCIKLHGSTFELDRPGSKLTSSCIDDDLIGIKLSLNLEAHK